MINEKTYVERIVIVLNDDGTVKGLHQESVHLILNDAEIINAKSAPAQSVELAALENLLPNSAALLIENNTLKEQIAALEAQTKALNEKPVTENSGVIVVDKASFKIALSRLGLLDTVLALVAGADTELQILFNDKTEFHSNNKVLNDFAQQNGMSAQLQEVFSVAQQVMLEL